MQSKQRQWIFHTSRCCRTATDVLKTEWEIFLCRHLYPSGRCSCQIGRAPGKRSSDVFRYCHLARLKSNPLTAALLHRTLSQASPDRGLPYTCRSRVPLAWGHLLAWLTLPVMHSYGRGGVAFLERHFQGISICPGAHWSLCCFLSGEIWGTGGSGLHGALWAHLPVYLWLQDGQVGNNMRRAAETEASSDNSKARSQVPNTLEGGLGPQEREKNLDWREISEISWIKSKYESKVTSTSQTLWHTLFSPV